MFVVASTDELATAREVTGGKGASLAKLVRAGFDVPPFVVVTVEAHRQLASAGELPGQFLDELRDAYESIGGDAKTFAVRSSAVSEDAATGSSAGLYVTRLGVRDFQQLIDALHECWKSLDNAAAVRYREDRAQGDGGGMAVVVQEFVEGDWSGVTFTVNPVNLSLSEMVINAVRGVGEALVSGEVNPEEIVLRRADGTPVRQFSGADAAMPAALLSEVWRRSKEIESAYGFPQDVEWTIRDGRFFALQSRPVTTVAGVFYNRYLEPWAESPETAEDPDVVWTRAYGDEVWTSPESPLNYSIRNPAGASAGWFGMYLPMHGDERPLPPASAKTYMAAAYANVDVLRRVYEYHPKFARISGILNFFPRSMQHDIKTMPWRWRGRLRRHWQLERKDREKTSIAHNHRYVKTVEPSLIDATDRWFDTDLDSLTLDELRAHMTTEIGAQLAATGLGYAVAVMYHSFDLTFVLTGLLDRWFGGGDALYASVSSGLPNSETVGEAQAIFEMAAIARAADPDALSTIRSSTWRELRKASIGDDALAPFVSAFESFLRDHRHRGAAYKDIMFARWGDQPDLLLDLVKGSIDSSAESPADKNRQQAGERARVQAELLRRCRVRPLRRAALRWLFRYNEIYMAIRNDHRFYFDRLWYARRLAYLSIGRRLTSSDVLVQADDVFFLGTAEIDAAFAGELTRDELYARIGVRRSEWEQTLVTQAPKFLRGYVPMPDGDGGLDRASGTLTGIAASPGTAVGAARVIFRIEELSRVQDGDILVTRQTDPGWTPVFSKIGGLVLETGGVLAHGTSLCREYGLPCVTVVEHATNRIADGTRIEIDGSAGIVRISDDRT